MAGPRLRLPPGLGGAFWLALLWVGAVELSLHSEAVVHRYRSVFALGRAYDKLHYVERNPPAILFVGNSRADNGIDPRTVSRAWPEGARQGFNLGVPGANALIYHGALQRLDARGLLGGRAIRTVVLALDENSFQEDNSLGYIGFLADRDALFAAGRYQDWLGSYLRLWAYSDNLRQLREPEKALRFIQASLRPLDPIGGGAATYRGYRAGFRGTQNAAQERRQERTAQRPPAAEVETFLWRAIALLQARGVRVLVTIPPLRDRTSAFFDPSPAAAPYRQLRTRLQQQGVTVLPAVSGYAPAEFINAGHLNDRGAQRFSAALGRQLAALNLP
jgi:hypothetical protein